MNLLLPALLVAFAPPPPGQDYEQTVTQLETAVENFASEDRQASIDQIEEHLDLLTRYPGEVPDDHTVSDGILRARVILAGLYLAEGNEQAAHEAMDEAIRTARDQPLGARAYGPAINDLYERRKAALDQAGTATLEIECEVECEVVINERLGSAGREDLLLGSYRVWIKASQADAQWEYQAVELSAADEVQTVAYADPSPAVEPPPAAPLPSKTRKRMLPRGAEIAGAAVGVGLLVTGAILLSFNGKCEKTNLRPTDATTFEQCGDLYQTNPAGFSLLGVGGGLLVISGVLLSVDEVRVGREKGRQVMVGASFRF